MRGERPHHRTAKSQTMTVESPLIFATHSPGKRSAEPKRYSHYTIGIDQLQFISFGRSFCVILNNRK
jgi:hypothetical protein